MSKPEDLADRVRAALINAPDRERWAAAIATVLSDTPYSNPIVDELRAKLARETA